MRILLRHFAVALLPLVLGLAAGWTFAFTQQSCGRLVGPIFAPKCHWVQLEYQIMFHLAGTALGCLIAAMLGARLEVRSRRALLRTDSHSGATS
ncbi:MAG: hypothetical protein ACREMN_10945 [Gemmatimonadales bacterium]